VPYAARLRDFNCSFCLVVVVRAQASVRRAGRGGCRADPGQGAAAAALIRGAAQEAACPACLLRTLLPQTSLIEIIKDSVLPKKLCTLNDNFGQNSPRYNCASTK
jgi:hypothetical protein